MSARAGWMAAVLVAGLLAGSLGLAGCGETPGTVKGGTDTPQETVEPIQGKNEPAEAPGDNPEAETPSDDIETHGSLGDFEATLLGGEGTFTQDNIAAKDVTVINFWSTTCGPCINEMPEIAAFADALPDTVQVVTVCLDGLYSSERATTVNERSGYEGATLINATGGLAALVGQVQYTPTTVFVAQDGTLVGDALVGVPQDLEEAYLAGVNEALAWQGKPPIALDA